MSTASPLESALAALGRELRDAARAAVLNGAPARPAAEGDSDVQYGLDVAAEAGLLTHVERILAAWLPIRVISEGLPRAGIVVGKGSPERRLVIDPVDGTRGLMHDKRSAFVLAGVAPEADARLGTLEAVALVEIPVRAAASGDVITARRGGGWRSSTDAMSGVSAAELRFRGSPDQAADLAHGFASVARFFPGVSARLDAFTRDLFRRLEEAGLAPQGTVFEDQYLSNGGQMHAILTGRDRLVVDFRALLGDPGRPIRSGHPYDLLASLILSEAGCPVEDAVGRRLDAPLDLTTRVPWVGYANAGLREAIEPHLAAALASAQGPVEILARRCKWRIPEEPRIAEAWRMATQWAQRMSQAFQAPVQDPPHWDSQKVSAICDIQCELATPGGPFGWRVSYSESYGGPAETFCVWRAAFAARGLPEGWRLTFAVTRDNGTRGSECELRLSGPASEVEGVLEAVRGNEGT